MQSIVYACSEWDHDDAYYLELPFSTGVKEPLYEIIENEPSIIFPDIIEDWENEEEFDYSEECEYWIGVLSDLDKYLFAKNQIERNAG